MTNKELELAIAEKVREIRDLYHKNHPKGKYLAIDINGGDIFINNSYWAEDKEFPINYWEPVNNDER